MITRRLVLGAAALPLCPLTLPLPTEAHAGSYTKAIAHIVHRVQAHTDHHLANAASFPYEGIAPALTEFWLRQDNVEKAVETVLRQFSESKIAAELRNDQALFDQHGRLALIANHLMEQRFPFTPDAGDRAAFGAILAHLSPRT